MDTFYLGTHEPSWLGRADFPLCVARQRLWRGGRSVPEAVTPWMMDSGAYQELDRHGHWTITPKEYTRVIRRAQGEVGMLDWCAPMDWMCEPHIRAKTGLSTADHQRLTVQNFIELKELAPELPFRPVLQGWEPHEYARCAELYDRYGVDLAAEPVVGLGGVCRLQHTDKAGLVLGQLAPLRLPLHGYGFKMKGLAKYHRKFASGDSMAWSFNARKNPPLPGCAHPRCNNCFRRAVWWRERLMAQIGDNDA